MSPWRCPCVTDEDSAAQGGEVSEFELGPTDLPLLPSRARKIVGVITSGSNHGMSNFAHFLGWYKLKESKTPQVPVGKDSCLGGQTQCPLGAERLCCRLNPSQI